MRRHEKITKRLYDLGFTPEDLVLQRPSLPKPLKNLDRMGQDATEISQGDKILVISLGGSAADFLPYFTNCLEKYDVRYQIGYVYQSDKIHDGYRKVIKAKKIEPFGCYQIIIFDNSSRTFKSMAGGYDWVLPRAKDWSIPIVHNFVIDDGSGCSNSTELTTYKKHGLGYLGPLWALYYRAPEIYKKLQNEGLTSIISTFISPTHLQESKISLIKHEIQRKLAGIKYETPESQQKIIEIIGDMGGQSD